MENRYERQIESDAKERINEGKKPMLLRGDYQSFESFIRHEKRVGENPLFCVERKSKWFLLLFVKDPFISIKTLCRIFHLSKSIEYEIVYGSTYRFYSSKTKGIRKKGIE
jgi:hypothetical protein